jgi:hypothetical protein
MLRIMKRIGLLSLCLTALVLTTGCQQRYTWNPASPPEPTDSDVAGKHIILFAPVTLNDSIDQKKPTTRLDFAYDMAAQIQGAGVSAWVGETLPEANDPAWPSAANPNQSLPGAANGAHLVVLPRLTDLVFQKPSDVAGDPKVIATVEIAVWSAEGQVWQKAETGRASQIVPAKQPLLVPESKAAWNAFKKAMEGFKMYLDTIGDPIPIGSQVAPAPAVAPVGLVTILVDSVPQGADIEINGRYRGNTPAKVPMPAREITLTLKLQGHQSWERVFVPEAGLPIKPTLQPEK